MSDLEPKFWDARDSEQLTHENRDDAIHEALDYMQLINLAEGTWTLPRSILVRGFVPMRVSAGSPERLLEHIMELLDEEHADPDSCELSKPTPAMHEAAKALIDVVEREYVSWRCEEITSEKVDVCEWMSKNATGYWDDFPGVDHELVSWVGER